MSTLPTSTKYVLLSLHFSRLSIPLHGEESESWTKYCYLQIIRSTLFRGQPTLFCHRGSIESFQPRSRAKTRQPTFLRDGTGRPKPRHDGVDIDALNLSNEAIFYGLCADTSYRSIAVGQDPYAGGVSTSPRPNTTGLRSAIWESPVSPRSKQPHLQNLATLLFAILWINGCTLACLAKALVVMASQFWETLKAVDS